MSSALKLIFNIRIEVPWSDKLVHLKTKISSYQWYKDEMKKRLIIPELLATMSLFDNGDCRRSLIRSSIDRSPSETTISSSLGVDSISCLRYSSPKSSKTLLALTSCSLQAALSSLTSCSRFLEEERWIVDSALISAWSSFDAESAKKKI